MKTIASWLLTNSFATALHDVVALRWDNYDVSPWMPYLVDCVAEAALPILSQQLDMEAMAGMAVAESVEEQRALLKKSIILHKYLGTPYSLRAACRSIGFEIIELVEGPSALDGLPPMNYAPEVQWALFRVEHEALPTKAVTLDMNRKLKLFVETYKPQRSICTALGYVIPEIPEPMAMSEDSNMVYNVSLFGAIIDDDPFVPNLDGNMVYLPSGSKYGIDDDGRSIADFDCVDIDFDDDDSRPSQEHDTPAQGGQGGGI